MSSNHPSTPIHVTVSGAVFRYHSGHAEVLLVDHLGYQMNVFPGGHVDDADASAASAVVRELHEETGLLVRLVDDEPWQTAIYASAPRPGSPGHQHVDLLYVGVVDGDQAIVHQPDEVAGARWVALDALPSLRCRSEVPATALMAWRFVEDFARLAA